MNRLPARLPTVMERARIDRAKLERLEILLRTTTDWELWRENRHLLPTRVWKAEKRGEIRALSPIVEYLPGMCEVYVRRLKPRPPRYRRPLIAVGVALDAAALATLALHILFQALAVALAPAVVVCAIAWIIFHLASDHGTGCKGLHCPGCRG